MSAPPSSRTSKVLKRSPLRSISRRNHPSLKLLPLQGYICIDKGLGKRQGDCLRPHLSREVRPSSTFGFLVNGARISGKSRPFAYLIGRAPPQMHTWSARRGGHPAAELVNDDTRKPRRRGQPARMSKARPDVAFSRLPAPRHGGGGEVGHLGGKIGGVAFMHEVEDRHCRVARFGETTADI